MGLGEQYAEPKAQRKEVVLGDKEYRGPRGNISQGGGAFLNHPQSKVTQRTRRISGYQGHKPFADVVSRPLSAAQQLRGVTPLNAFEHKPIVQGSTYVVPGYSGWVPGAQATLGETACRHPSPSKRWADRRVTQDSRDSRNYRAEVNGIVPGYKGHIPGGMQKIGGSKYGGIQMRAHVRGVQRWTQSRLNESTGAAPTPDSRPKSARARMETPDDVRPMSFRTAMADETIAPIAEGVMRRSGGMVPRAAAFAAVRTALRGEYMRKQHETKLAEESSVNEYRTKTQSGIVTAGLVPGYKGHVPHHRGEVGISPYKGRGADSGRPLGVPAAFAPRSAFHAPPTPPTDVVQIM